MHSDASFLVELGFLLILLGGAGALALRVGLSTAPLFLLAGLLIDRGANPDARDALGMTLLMDAASHDRREIVKLLLTKGADANAQTPKGATALMGAAFNGHLETVRLLVESGADVGLKSNNGLTALAAAKAKNRKAVVEYLETASFEK